MSEWWRDLPKPVSGVANCHVVGLFSFIVDDNTRVFLTNDWTTLSVNFLAEALGFHNHHRSISIKVLNGELLNIAPTMTYGTPHPCGFKPWEWDSILRGGKGAFSLTVDEGLYVSDEFKTTHMDVKTPPHYMSASTLHSVQQLTKRTAWAVREHGESTGKPTQNWSAKDLTKWHKQHNMYLPLSQASIHSLWPATFVDS